MGRLGEIERRRAALDRDIAQIRERIAVRSQMVELSLKLKTERGGLARWLRRGHWLLPIVASVALAKGRPTNPRGPGLGTTQTRPGAGRMGRLLLGALPIVLRLWQRR